MSDFKTGAISTSLPPAVEGQDGGKKIIQPINYECPHPSPPPLEEGAKTVVGQSDKVELDSSPGCSKAEFRLQGFQASSIYPHNHAAPRTPLESP